MFEPANRFMLVDALRPPAGCTLDTAIGTTFTLDLDALLLATLSFAVVEGLEDDDGKADPIALLESARRQASNITVFAQAGALSGPRNHPPILSYLEDSVIPVKAARPGHIFHPKVWALKFVDEDEIASYRLLVLSRNLTFDSSWDTIVRLDSTTVGQPRQHDAVVADFIETLPGLTVNPLSNGRAVQLAGLAHELRSVAWEKPEGVRSMWFHPMGSGGAKPNLDADRIFVMSPFLGESTVRELGEAFGENILISRPQALDSVGKNAVSGFVENTFIMESVDDFEDVVDEESSTTPDDVDVDVEPPRPGNELSGLHAKVFVTEKADYTSIWLGSANATGPAFGGNEEFMVECNFRRDTLTIDTLLDSGEPSLRSMLAPYSPQTDEPLAPSELEEASRRLDALVRELAANSYTVQVSPGQVPSDWAIDLTWTQPNTGQLERLNALGATVHIGPATQSGFRVRLIEKGAHIESASLEAITSFLSIEASCRVDGQNVVARSLVNAQLHGAPEDRNEQLLAKILDDPDKVLRYLLFLLAELTGDSTLLDAFGGTGGSFSWTTDEEAPPILESLLRAVAHAPHSLDRVAEFVADLRRGPAGAHLPPGFDEIWEPINQVREAHR